MLKTVSSITNAIGALNYKGTWDANANSPALTSSVGTKGDYYVVSTAGTTNLNGISNWGVGDWAAFNGSVWQRVEGGADGNFVNLSVSGTSNVSTLSGTGQIITTVQGASLSVGVNTGISSSSYTNYKGTNAASTATSWIVGINPYAVDGSGEFVDLATGLGLHLARNTGNANFDGNLKVGTGAAVGGATAGAGGVAFPATAVAVADANTLDDYEEGTFTPTLTFNNASVGITYNQQVASYTKVGRMVYFTCRITLTSKGSSTGDAQIQGLPFTVLNTSGSYSGAYLSYSDSTSGWNVTMQATLDINQTYIYLRYNNGTNSSTLTNSNFTNTTDCIWTGSYQTA